MEYDLNHDGCQAEPKKIARHILNTEAKKRIIDEPSTKPLEAITKVLKMENFENREQHINETDIDLVRNNIYHTKRKLIAMPKMPKNIEEVHAIIEELKPKTHRGEDFVLVNDATSHIVVFSCASNMDFLSTCENMYVDGTFKYSPQFFKQLFTIHGLKNGHYVPLVFCLLDSKQELGYRLLFESLKEIFEENNLILTPAVIIADFELGIQKAAAKSWPRATIFGCRFHLSQSWYVSYCISLLVISTLRAQHISQTPTENWKFVIFF